MFKDEMNNNGSIVLHKPHPDTTMDLIMIRSIGKRLTKWFGWDESTFVAVKESGEKDGADAEGANISKEM